MGLTNAFRNAAQTVVNAFGDVGASTNYASYASTTYNTSAGVDTAVYATVAGVTVIFDSFELSQIDGIHIQPEDKKAFIPAKAISAVTPKAADRIIQSGVVWNVVNMKVDPAGALHVLQVRKS